MVALRTRLGYQAPHVYMRGVLGYELGIVTTEITPPSLVAITAISATEYVAMTNTAGEYVEQTLGAAEYVEQTITVEDSV